MLRLLSAEEGAKADLTAPSIVRLLAQAIDSTLGAEIDDLLPRLAAMEASLAAVERRCRECRARQCASPTPILSRRERAAPLPAVILEDAERRLAEGIDLELIADGYGMSPAILAAQLAQRSVSQRRRAGGGG